MIRSAGTPSSGTKEDLVDYDGKTRPFKGRTASNRRCILLEAGAVVLYWQVQRHHGMARLSQPRRHEMPVPRVRGRAVEQYGHRHTVMPSEM
jgi:hypothetical protein